MSPSPLTCMFVSRAHTLEQATSIVGILHGIFTNTALPLDTFKNA